MKIGIKKNSSSVNERSPERSQIHLKSSAHNERDILTSLTPYQSLGDTYKQVLLKLLSV